MREYTLTCRQLGRLLSSAPSLNLGSQLGTEIGDLGLASLELFSVLELGLLDVLLELFHLSLQTKHSTMF